MNLFILLSTKDVKDPLISVIKRIWFSETRGFLSYVLARKYQVLGLMSDPPAAELDGEDRHIRHSGANGILIQWVLGGKVLNYFERLYIGYR